jgi:hypothetical protein
MRDALNISGRPIFFSMCGRSNNSSLLLPYYISSSVKNGVLINQLYGQEMLEIVGEQQETFRITGNRC